MCFVSRVRTNISLLWSYSHFFGPTVYKHSVPTGLGCVNYFSDIQ